MRFVIIGGGPAGNQAAMHAASLGVDVTLIERDIVGGAANLWDCIPSKAMIATGGAMATIKRIGGMGTDQCGCGLRPGEAEGAHWLDRHPYREHQREDPPQPGRKAFAGYSPPGR